MDCTDHLGQPIRLAIADAAPKSRTSQRSDALAYSILSGGFGQ